jgi:hypothetical protein
MFRLESNSGKPSKLGKLGRNALAEWEIERGGRAAY